VTVQDSIGTRCNIGPAELARRRRSAILFSFLAAAVAFGLLALEVPAPARLAFFPFAAGAAVSWAQVFHRFCVAFGAIGIENFGSIGEQQPVDPRQRVEDRRRVAQLVLEGCAAGAALTLVLVVLPL
jgi:hypothetical protein